jgi:predicted Ser/Thr protein kinase
MDETEYLNRRLGQTLCGKWTLERLLGWGGMAAVYVGVHRIGRRDAIKILHEEVAVGPETRARFEQEAHAVNRLGHPGAVEVRDIDVSEDGCPFLVMELLEGRSLAAVLESGESLHVNAMLGYADQVLDVLASAHDHGIVHRDIKPDNLFVCTDGRLKVLDFGVARMKEGAPRTLVTRTGMAVGTLTYMAPEQVRGVHIDGRVDVFAVGATMFRCITRRRIHEGVTEADILIKMATLPAPPVESIVPGVPPDLALVVNRALQFAAKDRYPDARTMQEDVRALLRGEPPPYVRSQPVTVAESPGSIGLLPTAPGNGTGAPMSEATRADAPHARIGVGAAVAARTATMDDPVAPVSRPAPCAPVAPTLVEPGAPPTPRKGVPLLAIAAGVGVLLLVVVASGAAVLWYAFAEGEEGSAAGDLVDVPAAVGGEGTTVGATTRARLAPTGASTGASTGANPVGGSPPATTGTAPATTTTTTATVPTSTIPFTPPQIFPPGTLPGIPPTATGNPPSTTPPTTPPSATPPTTPPSDKDKGKGKGKGKGKDKDD